jgi:hypothetical protein
MKSIGLEGKSKAGSIAGPSGKGLPETPTVEDAQRFRIALAPSSAPVVAVSLSKQGGMLARPTDDELGRRPT